MPTHLKLLRGNAGHQAINKDEPQPALAPTIPEPPPFLVSYAADEWHSVAPELYRLGLLTTVDLTALAAYCQAYGYWRQAVEALAKMAERDELTSGLMLKTANGGVMQNPLFLTAKQASKDMIRYASEFGLTPAARSRITSGAGGGGEAVSKFHGLIAG
jgi:P27 family predicted phage terminase small subunit